MSPGSNISHILKDFAQFYAEGYYTLDERIYALPSTETLCIGVVVVNNFRNGEPNNRQTKEEATTLLL